MTPFTGCQALSRPSLTFFPFYLAASTPVVCQSAIPSGVSMLLLFRQACKQHFSHVTALFYACLLMVCCLPCCPPPVCQQTICPELLTCCWRLPSALWGSGIPANMDKAHGNKTSKVQRALHDQHLCPGIILLVLFALP